MDLPVAQSQDLLWVLDKLAAARKKPPAKPPSVPALPKKDLVQEKKVDLELWKKWKESGEDKKHLTPLLRQLKPFIATYANKFKNRVEVPTAAIDFDHHALTVKALKSYDPQKGVALTTWVGTNLQKGGRLINKTQNFARIPEHISRHIGTYKAVKADLTERLGHEPDDLSLHEEANKVDPRITFGVIKRLNKEIRKGLIESGADGLDGAPQVGKDDREREVALLIYHQLSPQERLVHEYSVGLNGKPVLGTGQIAKKLKWDDSKVSKLKKAIGLKMKPFLEEG